MNKRQAKKIRKRKALAPWYPETWKTIRYAKHAEESYKTMQKWLVVPEPLNITFGRKVNG